MHTPRRTSLSTTVTVTLLALVAVTLAACASGGGRTATNLPAAAPARHYQVDATVLANDRHGPQACHSVLDSLPPQCGGVPLRGFTWAQLPPASVRRAGAVTWAGGVHLVGSYDGTTLTLTQPPTLAPSPTPGPKTTPSFDTPCTPPAGGWRLVDPAKVRQADWSALDTYVNGQPDYAASWLDPSSRVQGATGQPAGNVYTAAFTGDVDAHRRAIAAVWGGAVCVVRRAHSRADVARVQQQLFSDAARKAGVQALSGGTTVRHGTPVLAVTVLVDSPQVEAWILQRAGTVPVKIDGWLEPVTG
jgi:hypothetical protein